MFPYEKFPYSNTHDMNLDWILDTVKNNDALTALLNSNFTTIQNSENTRISSENMRQSQENTRVGSETVRGLNESSRLAAETIRQAFYNGFSKAIAVAGNASPKGVYTNVSDLQAAIPTGNSNVYLISSTGHWHYWNGSTWADGGIYQSTGIGANEVTEKNLSGFSYSELSSCSNVTMPSQATNYIHTYIISAPFVSTLDVTRIALNQKTQDTNPIIVYIFTYDTGTSKYKLYSKTDLGIVSAGVHTIDVKLAVPHDAQFYVGLSANIAYGAGTTFNYGYVMNTIPGMNIGDEVTITDFSSSTAFNISLANVKGSISKVMTDIDTLNQTVSDDITYSSAPIPAGTGTNVSKSMLYNAFPYSGYITKLYKATGTAGATATVNVYIYSCLGTFNKSNIRLEKTIAVNFVNNVANVNIYVKKGQYIAIAANATTWFNTDYTIPFVYDPDISFTVYNGTGTLCFGYDMTTIVPFMRNANTMLTEHETRLSEIEVSNYSRWAGKKIYLMGDSISSTDYIWYKDFLEKKTGATVYNAGFSGYNTAYIASNTSFARMTTYAPDLVVCLIGGNDDGAAGTVGTFDVNSDNGKLGEPIATESNISNDYYVAGDFWTASSYQSIYMVTAITHIIRKFNSLYYDFKANAGVTGGVDISSNTMHTLEAQQKPRFVMLTCLPQKRSYGTFSNSTNWTRKRNACLEAAEKYNVPCIDIFKLCRWDWTKEPIWTPPTDKLTSNGIYTMDGLHPNEFGYDYLTNIIAENIKSI
jgi:lysophospholipase L1-like esterase